MTKKRFQKLAVAMCEKIQNQHDGTHLKGKTLKWYRDKDLTTIKANSYAEAWEMLKPAREVVGM